MSPGAAARTPCTRSSSATAASGERSVGEPSPVAFKSEPVPNPRSTKLAALASAASTVAESNAFKSAPVKSVPFETGSAPK